MPFFKSMEDWHSQSAMLLKARPTTTRITSTYSRAISSHARKHASKAQSTTKSEDTGSQNANPSENTTLSTATLTFKTYDPVSGVCLKYQTNKAAEIARLIGSLGRLGKTMAALPEDGTNQDIALAPVGDRQGNGIEFSAEDFPAKDDAAMKSTGAGGGGMKKKKKGKR